MVTAAKVSMKAPVLEGAKVNQVGPTVEVSGKVGSVKRAFEHPRLLVSVEGKEVVITAKGPSKKEEALMGTWLSHIKNMMKGVTEGFVYKMKIVYAHFPMKAMVKGDDFVVENFLGERHPRVTSIIGDTKVQVKGDIVEIEGPNKEHVGQTAANIEQLTAIKGYDPRVFQDGIYLIERTK